FAVVSPSVCFLPLSLTTLFRSRGGDFRVRARFWGIIPTNRAACRGGTCHGGGSGGGRLGEEGRFEAGADRLGQRAGGVERLGVRDRKSTRLNSSHLVSSYAVFC